MRRHLWVVVAIIAALAAGWWLGRNAAPARGSMVAENANADIGSPSANARPNAPRRAAVHAQSELPTNMASASKPLPPPGTPLKQTFEELKARADAGDAEAASRLFRDAQRCRRFRQLIRRTPQMAKRWLDEKSDGATAEDLKITDAFLGMAQSQLEFLRSNAALCSDAPEQVDSSLPLALLAAQLGDSAAANCYVGGADTFGIPSGVVDHPEWLSEYKQNALAYADATVEKGDWTMVSQLALAYEGNVPSLLGQVTGIDAAMTYRYLTLSRLGVQDNGKDQAITHLDARLKAMAENLTDEQKLAAADWARNAYQSYFTNHPKNPAHNSFTVCPSGGP